MKHTPLFLMCHCHCSGQGSVLTSFPFRSYQICSPSSFIDIHSDIYNMCPWFGRIDIIKVAILAKAIYRFRVIPIKLPMTFFTELKQTIQKCIWNHKVPVGRGRQAWGITLQDSRQYYKGTVIKTVWYWYRNRHTD